MEIIEDRYGLWASLIAFSCKARGTCPSCNTRRMVMIAADLVDPESRRARDTFWDSKSPK